MRCSCSEGDQVELRVTPDRYVTVRYAGASGDFNPIHIDEEFADRGRAAGPDPARPVVDGPGRAGRRPQAAGGDPTSAAVAERQFRGMGRMEQEIVVSGTVEVGRRRDSRR